MPDIRSSKSAVRSSSPLKAAASVAPLSTEKCQILAKKGFLTARSLTSEVALLLYSREFQLGVLLHVSPASGSPISKTDDGDSFAKSALTMILSEFESLGVQKSELASYAIGGAVSQGVTAIGEIAIRRLLWAQGLTLSAADLGGDQRRSVWMDVQSGRIVVRSECLQRQDGASATLQVAS